MHDKQASDDAFLAGLALIRKAADDERHFVKKAVNMALRAHGQAECRVAALRSSSRASWRPRQTRTVVEDALRELGSAAVQRRVTAAQKRSTR